MLPVHSCETTITTPADRPSITSAKVRLDYLTPQDTTVAPSAIGAALQGAMWDSGTFESSPTQPYGTPPLTCIAVNSVHLTWICTEPFTIELCCDGIELVMLLFLDHRGLKNYVLYCHSMTFIKKPMKTIGSFCISIYLPFHLV